MSIPDEIFARAEKLARRGGRSRSDVYSAALKEYVERHAPEEVTEAMNAACSAIEQERDAFLTTASRRVLERNEW